MKLKTKLEFFKDGWNSDPLINFTVDLAESFGLTIEGSSWSSYVDIIVVSGKKNNLNRFVRKMIDHGFELTERNPAGGEWR